MHRRQVLADLGIPEAVRDELLVYNESPFKLCDLPVELQLPLASEPHVAAWSQYASEAESRGGFAVLFDRLPQFRFPVRAGMSQEADYLAATRRGLPTEGMAAASGLVLEHPHELAFRVEPTAVGGLPVLLPRGRADFETLVQALSARSEPTTVPPSMGACMIRGFNNWDRVQTLKAAWEARPVDDGETWTDEFHRIQQQKGLYQDRFMIISDGPYSHVPAANLDLTDEAWQSLSLRIRTTHECTHYLAQRLFGVGRNHLLDETICDFVGMSVGAERFRAQWFLQFMGLEGDTYRSGGRMENYLGTPPLSAAAFAAEQTLLRAVATHLERFDESRPRASSATLDQGLLTLTLCPLSMEDMAASTAVETMVAVYRDSMQFAQSGSATGQASGGPLLAPQSTEVT